MFIVSFLGVASFSTVPGPDFSRGSFKHLAITRLHGSIREATKKSLNNSQLFLVHCSHSRPLARFGSQSIWADHWRLLALYKAIVGRFRFIHNDSENSILYKTAEEIQSTFPSKLHFTKTCGNR